MEISLAVISNRNRKKELLRLTRSGKTEQRVAFRCRIVLHAIAGDSNNAIAKELKTTRSTVIMWRERFKEGRIESLKKDLPRGESFPSLPKGTVDKIIEKTIESKPQDATHWSCRSMAQEFGVSKDSVQRIWNAHGLKPHLVKTFKLSNDPQFTEKLTDVVGLYMNPPENALVFCIDEKSQIQALDRTQPSLPMKKGRAGTMTHDYKRHGTTTLFAALDILKGEVIGSCMQKHRHQEFLKFLRKIDRETQKDLEIHCVVDNYATHKKKEVKEWLKKHPRFHFHFIPTSSSWLNLVERWFAEITRKQIRRGTFQSVEMLESAIYQYIEHNNKNPKPFTWTKSAEQVIEKLSRCKALVETLH